MNDDMQSVLRHLAEHFRSTGTHRLDTPFDVPGLAFNNQVAPALRRLAEASPPFVTGIAVAQADYPIVVTGLTERGWEATEAAERSPEGTLGGVAALDDESEALSDPSSAISRSSAIERDVLRTVGDLELRNSPGNYVSVEEVAAGAGIDHDTAIRFVAALIDSGLLRGKLLRGDGRIMSINGIGLLPEGRSALAAQLHSRMDLDDASSERPDRSMARTVFLVHGHDSATKVDVARTVHLLTGNNPVILHEKPNQGRTLVEKFEGHAAEAGFVVVLATGDDVGRPKSTSVDRPRARQNVVFEWGFFVGALGRDKVAVLYEEGVELPSDILGVAYIVLGVGDQWKHELAREMRSAGLDADSNRL